MLSLIQAISSNRSLLTALFLGTAVWFSVTDWEEVQKDWSQFSPSLGLTPAQTQVARISLQQIADEDIRLFNAAKVHNWQVVRRELQAIQQANQQLKSVPASVWNSNGLEQNIVTLTQAVKVTERSVVIETSTRLLLDADNQADLLRRRQVA